MKYKERMELLSKVGRKPRYFELSDHVQELLKKASDERRIPQVTMLEHIIRSFCEPEKVRKNDVF